MTAITVDRSGRVRVDGALWGRVREHGVVTRRDTDGTGTVVTEHVRVGSVERVESAGPRGGKSVSWVAWSDANRVGAYRTRREAVAAVVARCAPRPIEPAPDAQPCPCGGSYVDGVCSSCDSCAGCAECPPKHSYAGSVSHEILSVDVQRFGAGANPVDRPASVVARVRVRYSYPDAPDATHDTVFSSVYDERVFIRFGNMGAGVYVDDPARFGSFSDDPVSWVHSFYA